MLRTFYRAKKKLSQLCLTLTEHDKMYLIFSDTDRAVKLESLIKTLGKIYFSGEDGLSNHNTIVETVTEHYRTLQLSFQNFNRGTKGSVYIIK